MENATRAKLEEKVFYDPNWIAYNGGFVHSNNVLFYFAQSPFFDQQSNNNSIFQQAFSDFRFSHWLNTRETFEAQLARISGVEYVVAYDPLTLNVLVDAPNGGTEHSNVWVIKKQNRTKRAGAEDQVTVLAYYYISGDAIYQAPSVAKVMTHRLLSTVTSLSQMLSTAAALPFFCASDGHTYLRPIQSPSSSSSSTRPPPPAHLPSQDSPEARLMPDAPSQHADVSTSSPQANSHQAAASTSALPRASASTPAAVTIADERTLVEALQLSLRYGHETMDSHPLVGEPGQFRLSKSTTASSSTLVSSSTAATTTNHHHHQAGPAIPHSQSVGATPVAPSTPTAATTSSGLATDEPAFAHGPKASPTTTTPGGSAPKPKRRKSKAANSLGTGVAE